ncbi:hypothetical protein [Streptomyces sp. NBC_00203]|uniref:hypothetical protein n=1 Tax=Streptomyces sp. NBC_00203 TaxID=2975680 RepID=UPI0038638F66
MDGGIRFDRVSVAYGGTTVLDSLDLTVEPGEVMARKDVEATDANAIALTKLMDGVEIFAPDWTEIDKNLQSDVEDWKTATGS